MLGMKNHFNISGSIEIREVDIAGVACTVVWGKLKFDSFTGGCYTPLTHAAIDRTLTTILVSL